MTTKRVDTVRGPTVIGRIATGAIWLWLTVMLAHGLGRIGEIAVLGGFGGEIAGHAALVRSDEITAALSTLTIVATGVAAIPVLRWFYVTNRNAHAVSSPHRWGPLTSPIWAVLWFFVPVASLLRPFSLFSGTWRLSAAPDAPETVRVPALLRWWWGLWLAHLSLGTITPRLYAVAKTPHDVIAADYLWLSQVAVDVPLVVTLTLIIRRLSAVQRAMPATGGSAPDALETGAGRPPRAATARMPARDPSPLGRVVIVSTVAWLLCRSVEVVQISRIAGVFGGDLPALVTLDHLSDLDGSLLVSLLGLLSFLSVMVGACWIYLTSHNAHHLSDRAAISPTMAVLWFLVPVAGWVKPFQAVDETWRISVSSASPEDVATPRPMRWWWASWLLLNALLCAEGLLTGWAARPEQRLLVRRFDLYVFPIEIVTAATFAWLVLRLSAVQRAALARRHTTLHEADDVVA